MFFDRRVNIEKEKLNLASLPPLEWVPRIIQLFPRRAPSIELSRNLFGERADLHDHCSWSLNSFDVRFKTVTLIYHQSKSEVLSQLGFWIEDFELTLADLIGMLGDFKLAYNPREDISLLDFEIYSSFSFGKINAYSMLFNPDSGVKGISVDFDGELNRQGEDFMLRKPSSSEKTILTADQIDITRLSFSFIKPLSVMIFDAIEQYKLHKKTPRGEEAQVFDLA